MAEYATCVERFDEVDYADMKSVRRYNRASDRMRAIVDELVMQGSDTSDHLLPFLGQPIPARCLAHHLVEKAELEPADLEKCFEIVEGLRAKAEAEGRGGDAMGEAWWLKEWRAKKGLA